MAGFGHWWGWPAAGGAGQPNSSHSCLSKGGIWVRIKYKVFSLFTHSRVANTVNWEKCALLYGKAVGYFKCSHSLPIHLFLSETLLLLFGSPLFHLCSFLSSLLLLSLSLHVVPRSDVPSLLPSCGFSLSPHHHTQPRKSVYPLPPFFFRALWKELSLGWLRGNPLGDTLSKVDTWAVPPWGDVEDHGLILPCRSFASPQPAHRERKMSCVSTRSSGRKRRFLQVQGVGRPESLWFSLTLSEDTKRCFLTPGKALLERQDMS